MDLDCEDVFSLKGGVFDVIFEVVGVVILVEFLLMVLDENKNGELNFLFESGLEVDWGFVGNGSRGLEGEREFDFVEMVRRIF